MEGKRAGGRALGRLQQELRRLDTDSPNLPRTRGLSRVGERDGPLAHEGGPDASEVIHGDINSWRTLPCSFAYSLSSH
jgi:hypothetical protein